MFMLSQEQKAMGLSVAVAFSEGEATSSEDIRVLGTYKLRAVRPRFLRDAFFYVALILRILSSERRFDAVHLHGDWSAFVWGRLIKKVTRSEVLVGTVHGATRKGFGWSYVYRKALEPFDVVLATGARDAKFLEKVGVSSVVWQSSGVSKVFNTQARTLFHNRDIDVIVVGNLLPVKNVDFVLDLAIKMPKRSFRVVGDGPERERLLKRCSVESIDNVEFVGSLNSVEVVKMLSRAKLLLSTSFSEGTPTSLLEAMSCGLPVVTSESNDYENLIAEGRNGYVVKSFDIQIFSARINSILDSESAWDEISQTNHALRSTFSWDGVAMRITKLSFA